MAIKEVEGQGSFRSILRQSQTKAIKTSRILPAAQAGPLKDLATDVPGRARNTV